MWEKMGESGVKWEIMYYFYFPFEKGHDKLHRRFRLQD
jgi:hypothetical protein